MTESSEDDEELQLAYALSLSLEDQERKRRRLDEHAEEKNTSHDTVEKEMVEPDDIDVIDDILDSQEIFHSPDSDHIENSCEPTKDTKSHSNDNNESSEGEFPDDIFDNTVNDTPLDSIRDDDELTIIEHVDPEERILKNAIAKPTHGGPRLFDDPLVLNDPLAVEDESLCASLKLEKSRQKKKTQLNQLQVDQLKKARQYLFSKLVGTKEVNESSFFTLAIKDDEISWMMMVWKCPDHPENESRLCRTCFDLKLNAEERRAYEKKHKLPISHEFDFPVDENQQCSWDQFKRIFDQCQMKVTKDGRVW